MRIINACLIILSFMAIALCDKTITLTWDPSDNVSDCDDIKVDLSSFKIHVNPIKNARSRSSEIGEHLFLKYLTNDDVGLWATEQFKFILVQHGLDVVNEIDTTTLVFDIKLLNFYVKEGGVYQGNVSFAVKIQHLNEKIWSGTASGSSTRWGRSFSKSCYLECICNSFLEAVCNLLKSKSLEAAILKYSDQMKIQDEQPQ